jgi:predicted metal-dependent hydrolase
MPVTLRKESLEAITLSLSLGREGILAINNALSATGPALKSPRLRATAICEQTDGEVSRADVERVLERFVYPTHDLRQHTGLSAEETYSALEEAIGDSPADSVVDIKLWRELKNEILALLGNEILAREAKARILLETRPNRVGKLSIFVDLRPLFDDAGDAIQFDVLTNTLCVEFKRDNQNSVMYFSLDSDDLEELAKQVERARRKTKAIEERSRRCDIPLVKVKYRDRQTVHGTSE